MKIKQSFGSHKVLFGNHLYRKKTDQSIIEKIKSAAKIVFSILLSLALFWVNPAIFFISFVVGVAFSKKIAAAVKRIQVFVQQHRWPVLGACSVMAALVLPVFIATGSAIWSAHVGSWLSQKAQEAYHAKRRAAVGATQS